MDEWCPDYHVKGIEETFREQYTKEHGREYNNELQMLVVDNFERCENPDDLNHTFDLLRYATSNSYPARFFMVLCTDTPHFAYNIIDNYGINDMDLQSNLFHMRVEYKP